MKRPCRPPLDEQTIDRAIREHPTPTGEVPGILEYLEQKHPHGLPPMETLRKVAEKNVLRGRGPKIRLPSSA